MTRSQKSGTWIVLKFGGTSVSSPAHWHTIASVLRERLAEGLRPLLVCSAMAGVTNELDRMLREAVAGREADGLGEIEARHRALAEALGIDHEPLLTADLDSLRRLLLGASLVRELSARLHARVLAHGEVLATRMGAAFLAKSGLSVSWHDARDWLVSASGPLESEARRILSASCPHEPEPELRARMDAEPADVLVTQGFIARDPGGDTVLLGRGGSDTSAALFAAKLSALRCEIWTDVPGMYSADPRLVPTARLLRSLDYDEAQEIASTGARVLHPRCLQPVRHAGIPLHVRCTERPELQGTVISADGAGRGAQVKAISARTGITLISMDTVGMWQQVGFLADVFGAFKRHGLSVDLVSTSETNVTVTLDPVANALDPAVVGALLQELGGFCRARAIGPCASVSLVGRDIRAILHQLAPALEVFEEQRIHLVTQAASDLNLSFVVDQGQAERLVRRLHALVFQHRQRDAVLGPTWHELFGEGAEAAEERAPLEWWRERRAELLRLAAAESPLFVYDEATLRSAAESLRALSSVSRVFYAVKANAFAPALRIFHEAGLGFECVSPGELRLVLELFPGLERSRLLFTPNFAPREEYALAYELGARVTLDNLHPLRAWPEVFAGRELLLRLDPGQGHGHHEHVRTAGVHSKFGIDASELDALELLLAAAGARVVGLHAHKGSGIRSVGTWSETALYLAGAAERFPDVRVLNVGGGLGVPEKPGQGPLDLDELDRLLGRVREAHPHLELWLEPGRFLVAAAGVLLATVTQLKEKGDLHYVGIDTGMNSLIRPALYGAYHEIVNLTRLDEGPTMLASVVGPICESGDTLGFARRLAPTREGDVLLLATAGAYGRAMSSSYNLRPPAGELLLPARA
jgi:bifunctional diaminopimelate decarboxylase / aspartate kinase